MSKIVVGMTLSLDGYFEDPLGSTAALYPDLPDLQGTEFMEASIRETGAVLMGRNTFDMADDPDWYAGNYEYQVPIFVVTHEPPAKTPKQDDNLTFTFVTDGVHSAVAQAKAAAGDKAVTVVGGGNLVQQLIAADLADELDVDILPVLLGGGRRLFEDLGKRIGLVRVSVQEIGPRTSMRFRVER